MSQIVYEGILEFLRETTKMAVYGDGRDLVAQYVPKTLLRKTANGAFPPKLEFTIQKPGPRGFKP